MTGSNVIFVRARLAGDMQIGGCGFVDEKGLMPRYVGTYSNARIEEIVDS